MPCDYTAIHQSVTAHRRPSLALQVPCPGGMEQAKARSEATGEHGGKKKTVLTRAPETPLPGEWRPPACAGWLVVTSPDGPLSSSNRPGAGGDEKETEEKEEGSG